MWIVRVLRFLLTRRGIAVAVAAARAKKLGDEWFPVRVEGISMIPTLRPGDMLAVRFPRAGEPRPGQIVVASRDRRELVKRVVTPPEGTALGADEFWLTGDNQAASTDSRATGPVHRRDIFGIVRSRYWPATRARRFGP